MEHGPDIGVFLLAFASALVGAKLLGELAERVGQPAVLGELLAGILLGPSVLGLVPLSQASFCCPRSASSCSSSKWDSRRTWRS